MDKVYVLVGWFGDQEWIEDIYKSKEKAKQRCDILWVTRTSDKAPDWCQMFCKFGVDEYTLKD